jgi:uncharacterized Zn finger protein (UPF0148 family)
MIIHCSKCGINWAALHSIADEIGDELYEFCPVCHTDIFLEDGTDITAFIMCPFTGKITDVDTGEQLHIKSKSVFIPQKEYIPQPHETAEQRQEMEDAAISAYQAAFHTLGKAAAEQLFFTNSKK